MMAREHAEVRADGLGLVDGDTWLGVAWLDWWLVGNTDTVDVELAVAPAYRRRGVATKLLDAAIERAKADGRRIVSGTNVAGDPVTGESPGTAFAAARGFVKKHAELHQVAELPMTDLVEQPVDGYEIVQWREHAPDEWLEQFVELLSGMSEDVPTGDRTSEAVRWTPELVRDAEDRRIAQGRFTYTTAAVHTASGELAAYTQMGGTPETPDRLNQYDTYVRRTPPRQPSRYRGEGPQPPRSPGRRRPPRRTPHLERPRERAHDRRQHQARLPPCRPTHPVGTNARPSASKRLKFVNHHSGSREFDCRSAKGCAQPVMSGS